VKYRGDVLAEKTIAMQNKERFLAEGKKIPTCVNQGCGRNVIVRDWKYYSFKHVCSDCKSNEQKGLPMRAGVKSHKKKYCENKDGRLGFECPVRPDFKFPNNVLHGDHIDGDHENNIPENLQTLCSTCHAIKGKQSGDFDSASKGRTLS
jgi:5-methylcytosine-specific restriction endonuclease McrA